MDTWTTVKQIRKQNPLVHCYTNSVAANYAANAVIALGASPMMAAEPLEAREMTSIASALSVNIGTLNPRSAEAMEMSAARANELGIPWVLDPVGVGASKLRRDTCERLIALKPSIVRGNASEIASLCHIVAPQPVELGNGPAKAPQAARGVDSTLDSHDAVAAAKQLAKITGGTVIVSGKVDWITDGDKVARCVNGHAMMAAVTATGCAISALLGAFAAVALKDDRIPGSDRSAAMFWAACHGMIYYGVVGELAAAKAGPLATGTMAAALLDNLGTITEQQFRERARPAIDLSVYLVTDPKLLAGRPLQEVVASSLESRSVGVVQLREKDIESGEFLQRAREIKALCDRYNVPLIIDDRLDIALAVDAAGLHIGQTDIPADVARKLLGPTKILGLSVGSVAEMQRAGTEGWDVDYYGVGPVYATQTKNTNREALGPEGFAEIVAHSPEGRPVVAIGGITSENAATVAGSASGIAVVTAITMARDPTNASRDLLYRFRSRE